MTESLPYRGEDPAIERCRTLPRVALGGYGVFSIWAENERIRDGEKPSAYLHNHRAYLAWICDDRNLVWIPSDTSPLKLSVLAKRKASQNYFANMFTSWQ